MRRVYSIVYHLIGSLLPDSYYYMTIFGKTFHIKIGLKIRRYLAKRIIKNCGDNVNIERFAHFHKNITIGNSSGIGKKCHIPEGTVIGSDVMMGPEIVIYNRNHDISRTDIPMRLQGFKSIEPVIIGNDVWIGRRVIILPGVSIGDGCVIGAGAVISKDIPPFSIAVGNPARIVRKRKAT